MGGAWSRLTKGFNRKKHIDQENLMPYVMDMIDDRRREYFIELGKAISIPSVSAFEDHHKNIYEMSSLIRKKLENLGAHVRFLSSGRNPPVVLADLKAPNGSRNKKTLLIYGHLDVQPAFRSDGWETNPFQMVRKGNKLYGRGASDDKGPVLGWIHAVAALKDTLNDLPVNIKFLFEGMEESGSKGLEDILESMKDSSFLKKVDYVCISDSYWLGKSKPCLGYGIRGNVNFEISVNCASQDLHSGVFGGPINEAMTDLIKLLDTLVDQDGKILIEGLYDEIAPVTSDEIELYNNVEFEVNEYKNDIGVNKLVTGDDKIKTLMATWRYPSLSIHGIEGAFSDTGAKTVIPKKVIGKFSIRIVPDLTVEKTADLVQRHLKKEYEQLNTPNIIDLKFEGSESWITSTQNKNFEAARKATRDIYGDDPDLTRGGGSIPVVPMLDRIIGKPILLLPMGASDDDAHAQNEKIDVRNYIEGTKLFASYLFHLGH
uniref:CNDP dipeptidase 2 (Metallopeptidase M20 family) [Megachile rotundata] n=1 Tax=Lepeophtheirus salmonis TaxID=72036 RepID=A0A0K2UGE7_LEPSM